MKVRGVAILAVSFVSTGCVSTPQTPMEVYLNRYAGAQAAAMNCPAYGGYSSIAAMKSDAETNLARARALGATDKDLQKARQNATGALSGAIILVGPLEACNSFIGGLAWAGTSTPEIKKKPK
jgi:hypothetical protein